EKSSAGTTFEITLLQIALIKTVPYKYTASSGKRQIVFKVGNKVWPVLNTHLLLQNFHCYQFIFIKYKNLCSSYTSHMPRGGLNIWKLGHCPRARGQ
ncbi:unnamed protein product, partial [Staurois parvus]